MTTETTETIGKLFSIDPAPLGAETAYAVTPNIRTADGVLTTHPAVVYRDAEGGWNVEFDGYHTVYWIGTRREALDTLEHYVLHGDVAEPGEWYPLLTDEA